MNSPITYQIDPTKHAICLSYYQGKRPRWYWQIRKEIMSEFSSARTYHDWESSIILRSRIEDKLRSEYGIITIRRKKPHKLNTYHETCMFVLPDAGVLTMLLLETTSRGIV